MSREISFTDAEMEALRKGVGMIRERVEEDPGENFDGSLPALESADRKLAAGLNRPSRRRAR